MTLRSFKPVPFLLDPSCVLYLPLYKKDGASFMSDDAYGYLATVTGATWGIQGRIFDGTDDQISIVPSSAYKAMTTQVSYMCWVKLTTLDNESELVSRNWRYGEFGLTSASKIKFETIEAPVLSPVLAGIVTGVWLCVGTSFNSDIDTTTFYLNGVSVGTSSAITNPLTNNNNYYLMIGAREDGFGSPGAGTFTDGTIGDVLVYNRTLTAVEFMRLYQSTKWRYQ